MWPPARAFFVLQTVQNESKNWWPGHGLHAASSCAPWLPHGAADALVRAHAADPQPEAEHSLGYAPSPAWPQEPGANAYAASDRK